MYRQHLTRPHNNLVFVSQGGIDLTTNKDGVMREIIMKTQIHLARNIGLDNNKNEIRDLLINLKQ